MPIFRYRGFKAGGAEAGGTVEAESPRDALAKLKKLGLYPKDISESIPKDKTRSRTTNLPAVTRQLAVLLKSGVPLVEALRAVSDENRGQWKSVLVGIRERVTAGASLSRALEDFDKTFPEFYRNMVASGESSGTLDRVLERLADFLEKQNSLREKVRSAMVYPALMAAVGAVVLSFMFVFVIPKIVRIFEDSKSALPFITVVLIWISNLFVHYWWLLFGVFLSFGYGLKSLRKRKRKKIDKALASLFGGLYLSRFTRTLGFLLAGGLPVIKALELSGKSTGNLHIEEAVRDAAGKVTEGARLSQSLAGLPPVLLQLIATGERSGKLAEVLDMAADSYEGEFERKVQRAVALLEPGMILLMGLVVGFIVLAVLLPMFQLNQLIR